LAIKIKIKNKQKVKYLLHFIGKKSLIWLIVGVIVGIFLAIIEIVFSAYIIYIFSILGVVDTVSVIEQYFPRLDNLYIGLFGFILLGVVRALLHALKSISAVASSEYFLTRLKYATIKDLIESNVLKISNHEISSLFSEIYSRSGLFFLAVSNAIPLIFQASVISIFLYIISPKYTTFGLVYLFFSAIFIFTIQKKVHPIVKPMALLNNKIHKSISRLVKNWFLIKIMRVEAFEMDRFERTLFSFTSKKMISTSFASLAEGLPSVFGVIMICFFIIFQFETGLLEGTVFVSFLYLFLRFVQVVGQVSGFISAANSTFPDFRYATSFFDKFEDTVISKTDGKLNDCNFFNEKKYENEKFQKSVINKNKLDKAPRIEVCDLIFNHSGIEKTIFDKLSFTVNGGEQIGIVGASGSGKSTLLSILLGIYRTKASCVSLSNLSTNDFMERYREQVAYAGPESFLFEGTVKENLLYGNSLGVNDKDIIHVLTLLGLKDWVNHQPNILEYLIREDSIQISTGQKQRIAIARAILRQPKLLILDEVTSNLDHETENLIINFLETLKGSVTVVIVTHRLDLITNADSILDLNACKELTANE
jgi:ABC-type bacteriocin/lantibiotic exporter with double-glycine peptidase domain